jgi:glutathione S-transferase
MKLYYSDVLSSHRACSVARYLNAAVEYIYLDLAKGDQTKPDYRAINPNGKVPTLVKGRRITWESDAVICQLSDDMGADLWPHDSRQVEIIRWFSWNSQHFTRAGGALYFENIIKQRFGIGAPDPAAVEEALRDFRRYAGVLNDYLCERSWIVGDSMTVADLSVAMTLPYSRDAQLPLNEFPQVRRWYDQIEAIEAWRDPYPARETLDIGTARDSP